MTAVTISWILLFVLGSLGTAAVWVTVRKLRAQVESAGGKESLSTHGEIAEVDKAIQRATTYFDGMLSLDELGTVTEAYKKSNEELNKEREQIKGFEGRLEISQGKVQASEKKHNELKRGKEEAERLALDLQANMQDLETEASKLQSELENSKEKMSSLFTDAALTDAQKASIKEIQDSLEAVLAQLMDLKQVSDQATERFLGLQTQYDELEQEYRRLVDKELEG